MSTQLIDTIINALEDVKGKDIVTLDVSNLTDVMDHIVVASGTSNRQVKALANNVLEEGKKMGCRALSMEGDDTAEWILVDFGDVVVHVMLPATREFYDLEKLWSVRPEQHASNTEVTEPQDGSGE